MDTRLLEVYTAYLWKQEWWTGQFWATQFSNNPYFAEHRWDILLPEQRPPFHHLHGSGKEKTVPKLIKLYGSASLSFMILSCIAIIFAQTIRLCAWDRELIWLVKKLQGLERTSTSALQRFRPLLQCLFFSHCLEKQYRNLGQFFPGLQFFPWIAFANSTGLRCPGSSFKDADSYAGSGTLEDPSIFQGNSLGFTIFVHLRLTVKHNVFWLIFTSKCWEPTEPTDMLTSYVSGSQKKQPTGWMVVWKDTSQKAGFDMITIRYN